MSVPVTRLPLRLTPDPHRVITRFFCPGDMNRARDIIARVLAPSETEVETQLAELERLFRAKHRTCLRWRCSAMPWRRSAENPVVLREKITGCNPSQH